MKDNIIYGLEFNESRNNNLDNINYAIMFNDEQELSYNIFIEEWLPISPHLNTRDEYYISNDGISWKYLYNKYNVYLLIFKSSTTIESYKPLKKMGENKVY